MFRKSKKSEIILCPQCKRPTLKQATNVSGWLDSALYRCSDPDCGYVGRFFITVDPKELAKQERNEDDDSDQDDEEDG